MCPWNITLHFIDSHCFIIILKIKIDQHIVVQTYFLCIFVSKHICYNKSHLSKTVLQDIYCMYGKYSIVN